ncbi:MAG: tetratricopeptide repeat protein [Myxococcaceae bacterium]
MTALLLALLVTASPTEPAGAPADTLTDGCQKGVAAACTNLGLKYATGNGVARDLVKAKALYEKACDGHDAVGCNNLSNLLAGDPTTLPRALELLASACSLGAGVACGNLGGRALLGLGVPQNLARAKELLERGCALDAADACHNLGVAHEQALFGGKVDFRTARELYAKGCELGGVKACVNLGMIYEHARGVPRDLKKAAGLYELGCTRAVGGDDLMACNDFANMLRTGRGVKKDEPRGRAMLESTCKAGLQQACVNLVE